MQSSVFVQLPPPPPYNFSVCFLLLLLFLIKQVLSMNYMNILLHTSPNDVYEGAHNQKWAT